MNQTKATPDEHRVMNRVQAAFTELGSALQEAAEHDIEVSYEALEFQTLDHPFPSQHFSVSFKRHLRPAA